MMGPVYFVTDPGADLPVVGQALAAARGGARLIQLRDKSASTPELAAQAQELQTVLAQHDAKLIINDRVDVAITIGAYGLHIGQSDGDPRDIRARIGPDMMLGLSVENADQLADVPLDCVDYLGVGPIRATASKPDHAPPIGFAGLGQITKTTPLPCYAIGGIGPGDAAGLRAAGAVGLAVVSAIARSADPEVATRALLEEWRTT
ncbi:thiamine phosphate synthase [Roseovarius sp. 2305UL8-3]|uniref:thiamine phosphate synthase n=1 Tax=Roseovarius conchicola TaxID=3121636 RepID=UPI003528DF02